MAKEQKAAASLREVRVLVDCPVGKAGQVVELAADDLKHWKAAGAVDDHPDAVAAAKSVA